MDQPDLIVCNYTYNHLEEGTAHTMAYRNVFPAETPCTWNDIGHFRPSQYLIMHALIYRTSVLRETGVCLPEHTFYVDNIFAYQPLPYVKKIYYMDIDLYQYFLGRADQSVNEEVMMRRIDQQIKVTKIVASWRRSRRGAAEISEACRLYVQKYFHHDGNFLHPSPSDQRPRRVGRSGSFCGIPSVRRTKCSTSD